MASLSRRSLLRIGAATAGLFSTAAGFVPSGRPRLTHGVQSGDVTSDGALVWTRADTPSRMLVEVAGDPSFRHSRLVRGPVLTPDSDGTGRLRLTGLPAGRELHYRVTAEDLDGRLRSEPVTGSFRTAPLDRRDVRFLWSGDVAGQGWGINPDVGGMRVFSAMADRRPDFFVHSGDTVYSDGPLQETVVLPDGRRWRNLVTEEKSKVAQTLQQFRGQHSYNRMDDNLRRFTAEVPWIVQWDDHETMNNWNPGQVLTGHPEYTETRLDVLSARAFQAFHEWHPLDRQRAVDGRVYRNFRYGPHVELFVLDMRSYRDPNDADTAPYERILGDRQARWLVNALSASRATWKIVAADMPIGLVVADARGVEAVANGKPGAPTGREAELAWVFRQLARRHVRNVVWLTADVHYTAAHHYSPERAAVGDFDPFWEFVSGPLHAGGFGPNVLDPTFGPEAVFVHAPPAANSSPLDDFQHFGEVEVDGHSGALTVTLRTAAGRSLWATTLRP
ncbi:alkaline phosphatase D [Kutzneria viridogrisea]|uniref:Phosphodiesterase/alkaline phosphatase D n=2 Tax=Kutzneria TaxID=43356 RepID=W5W384_9PSEU|nr:alkaline phosphatase D family protein [Kutzneria albida]AHH94966.1 phosphodiesterase/alkaline phosphatase D [Kutzneria albida DSM 43870]MBA8927679.1 alkaline phosphatase D [Kutzneria viridogrisea]